MKDKDGYRNISGITHRSQLNEDASTMKIIQDRPNSKQLVEPVVNFKPMQINLKDSHFNMKPVVLQNPHMQMYNSFTNYSVCPFCKFAGAMNISYRTSKKQKSCCFVMGMTGLLLLCCWVPFIVKDCSDQIYQCPSCKETLQVLPANKVT